MEKYQIIQKLGSGSFGVVWKAFNKQTHETVAIKKLSLTYESSSSVIIIKREVKSLMFNKHPNIVSLKEVISENKIIFLVFEYMQGSLYDVMINRSIKTAPFSEAEIRHVCYQILQGLACMHQNGYIHRDLKPENLLVSNYVIKIGDLGSAREMDDQKPYTHNVTTSWYRAPEVFLRSPVYGSAVDMWAVGAIMAELFTFQPLFPGSSEVNVMHEICSVLGTPTEGSWSEGLELARNMKYRFPELPGVRFSELLPSACPAAVNLIGTLLSWSPFARPTAVEALQHPFFHGCYRIPRSVPIVDTDVSIPAVFKLAMVREMLKKKPSLKKSCTCAHHDDDDDDIINMLPEYPFEFMK
ncbi:hypothetical protein R6Q59_004246 [Mikania micrantha]